jgi:hypothetical protein
MDLLLSLRSKDIPIEKLSSGGKPSLILSGLGDRAGLRLIVATSVGIVIARWFQAPISSKYKELLPGAHLSLCLCGLPPRLREVTRSLGISLARCCRIVVKRMPLFAC